MPELLSSKIIISEEDPTLRSPFPALTAGVLGIVGIAERGPIGEAVLLESFADYERIFGGYVSGRELPLAARAFFLNGGQKAYAVRTCHYTGSTPNAVAGSLMLQTAGGAESAASVTGTTTGPWKLQPGDTLVASLGNPAGAPQTATFNATAGSVTDTTPYPVADQTGLTLLLKIDDGDEQTVTFGSATTADDISDQINAQIFGAKVEVVGGQVRITSDKLGTGSKVEITGGTSTLSWAIPVDGTGNVENIKAVTIGEVKAILEAAWTNDAGVVVTAGAGGVLVVTTVNVGSDAGIQIQASSSCASIFGLDTTAHVGGSSTPQNTLRIDAKYPGAYCNSLKIKVDFSTSSSGVLTEEFNLQVLKNDLVVESFPNLTMDTAGARYAPTILNHSDFGSQLITAVDQMAVGSNLVRRPANNGSSGVAMTGGDDGLVGLNSADFIGVKADRSGFYALDLADEVTLLACPDNTTTAVQKAMIDYARIDRNGLVFAILDPQPGADITGIKAQRAALGADYLVENAALYWPGFIVANPSKAVYGQNVLTITVRPSGYIAGIMARNDQRATEGPFYQPAGVEGGKPTGIADLENQAVRFEESRDLIFPLRINPISYMRGYGIFIDGARTLRGDGNFPSIGERRGVSHIEKLLTVGLQWARHKNNTPALRAEVEKQIYSMLEGWMRKGAFASNTPDTAFFVDVSDALNPPSVVRAGKLVIRVGVATAAPAEFIIITVTRDTRAEQAELLGTSQ